MIRRLLLTANEALATYSHLDARIALISATIVALAIYLSNFNVLISIFAVFISLIACESPQKILKGLTASIPFILFFSISSYLLSGDLTYVTKTTFGVIALISVGVGILYGTPPEEVVNALVFFKVPYRYAFLIALAFRMFQIYIVDLIHVVEALKMSGEKGLSYYKKLMKTFASIAVLRSLAISEALYSKGFGLENVKSYSRKISKSDVVLLILSSFLLILAIIE